MYSLASCYCRICGHVLVLHAVTWPLGICLLIAPFVSHSVTGTVSEGVIHVVLFGVFA